MKILTGSGWKELDEHKMSVEYDPNFNSFRGKITNKQGKVSYLSQGTRAKAGNSHGENSGLKSREALKARIHARREGYRLDEATRNHEHIIPMEYEKIAKERAKKHLAKVYPDTATHRHILTYWYSGPRRKSSMSSRASDAASTRKTNAVGFKLSVRKVRKKDPNDPRHYGHEKGVHIGYIHPRDIGLKFHKDDRSSPRWIPPGKTSNISESVGSPSVKELNAAAYNIIDEILPDLEDAMQHSGSSVYNAVIDHVADRLYDMYSKQGVSGDALRKAAEYAAKQTVHDDRKEIKKKKPKWSVGQINHMLANQPKKRVKKIKEPKHDQAGFKTKLGASGKVRRGTGSFGHAKYTVAEDNSENNPIGEDIMKSTLQVIKEAAKAANKPKKSKPAGNPKVAMGGGGDSETGYEDFISAATDDSNLDKVYDKMREALKIKIAAAAMHGNTSKVKLLKKRLANLDKHRDGEGEKDDKD